MEEGSKRIQINDEVGIKEAAASARDRGAKTADLVAGRASSLRVQSRCEKFRTPFAECGLTLKWKFRGDYSYLAGQEVIQSVSIDQMPAAHFLEARSGALILSIIREAPPAH